MLKLMCSVLKNFANYYLMPVIFFDIILSKKEFGKYKPINFFSGFSVIFPIHISHCCIVYKISGKWLISIMCIFLNFLITTI